MSETDIKGEISSLQSSLSRVIRLIISFKSHVEFLEIYKYFTPLIITPKKPVTIQSNNKKENKEKKIRFVFTHLRFTNQSNPPPITRWLITWARIRLTINSDNFALRFRAEERKQRGRTEYFFLKLFFINRYNRWTCVQPFRTIFFLVFKLRIK